MGRKSSWKGRQGIVYSTAKDFRYDFGEKPDTQTPGAKKQDLRVSREQRKGGKKVTIVKGFKGNPNDLNNLAKVLKTKCGVGGTAKLGEILIQGDFRDKIYELLLEMGYGVKKSGG